MNIVFMSMDTLPSTLWARDLYDQMHIRSDFRKWFPRMCQYGFIEGRDYEYQRRKNYCTDFESSPDKAAGRDGQEKAAEKRRKKPM